MARSDQDPISRAVREEELALLRALPEEPAYLQQVLGLFSGRTAWVNAVMLLVQTALFIVGAMLAWRFFHETDLLTALRLGLSAGVLLLMSLIIKMALLPAMRLDVLRRDLKRLAVLVSQHEET